ncbi:MAG: AI-2E family transporter [Oscillospiraceae bacterium]|nr:AI-2E family transporter [Oscillospiraceae bacterium]MCR5305666.1 AI-2E family transporter [Oscillospiraceae bacterium]
MARIKKTREPVTVAQMSPRKMFFMLCGCILFAYCLINLSAVTGFLKKVMSALGPVVTGFIFAYILSPAASWLENRLNRLFSRVIRKHPGFVHFTRGFSAFVTVLIFIGSLALLVVAVSTQVVDGVTTLVSKMPGYVNTVTEKVEEIFRRDTSFSNFLRELNERFSASDLGMGKVDAVDLSQKILSTVSTGLVGTLGFLYDVVIGFVIAIYLLISRKRFVKQTKQILYAVCRERTANWINERITSASKTFGTAVLGKFVDSLIIGMLCFAGNKALGIPYATLIAVIIGVTNMIPFFGPIIGAIPCVLLVLMENPVKALYFAAFVIVLQQLDANILDPRIVGSSIGLPAFWELFACMLGGGLFGIGGLIIGVPAFAVIYGLVRDLVHGIIRDRVQRGELEGDFVRETLGFEPQDAAETGLFQSVPLSEDVLTDLDHPSPAKENAAEQKEDTVHQSG